MLDECAGLVLVAAWQTGNVSCVGCGPQNDAGRVRGTCAGCCPGDGQGELRGLWLTAGGGSVGDIVVA